MQAEKNVIQFYAMRLGLSLLEALKTRYPSVSVVLMQEIQGVLWLTVCSCSSSIGGSYLSAEDK